MKMLSGSILILAAAIALHGINTRGLNEGAFGFFALTAGGLGLLLIVWSAFEERKGGNA